MSEIPRRILITGSNRGIGLDLVQRYVQQGNVLIFATCRHPESADALNALAAQHPTQIKVIPLDVRSEASIAESRRLVGEQVDGLDMLINNAGIYPSGVAGRDKQSSIFGSLAAATMTEVFFVNSVTPVIVAQTYAGLLRKGRNARIINMSSDAGSITLRGEGCNYSYPASKAALNMMTCCLAGDFRADGVIVISIHPGWIQTDMGGPDAFFTLDETIPSMMQVIDGLTLAESGKFFNWDGKPVAW
jgi:NAD(P)-dependent dehydrogenase (short-subunit alcohol dehydrogenase family)